MPYSKYSFETKLFLSIVTALLVRALCIVSCAVFAIMFRPFLIVLLMGAMVALTLRTVLPPIVGKLQQD